MFHRPVALLGAHRREAYVELLDVLVVLKELSGAVQNDAAVRGQVKYNITMGLLLYLLGR